MGAMDRETGKEITDLATEVEQSLDTILTTIPGDRVMRADYGSRLFELTDTPLNQSGNSLISAATVEAVRKHEKRLTITAVRRSADATGQLQTEIVGTVKQTNEQIIIRK